MRTYLILSDLHFPYQCPNYLKITSKILKSTRFDGICQLGDALDFFQLSTYDKDPARKNTIKDDIDEWDKVLTGWCKLLPKGAEIHLLEGNHEHRLSRYISRHARELHEIVPDMPKLLHLKERNESGHVKFIWHKYTKWASCKLGDCHLFHGFFFNTHTAATNLARYRVNSISGHTHRLDYRSDGYHYAISLGHGSDEQATAHTPTPTGWTQALAVLTVDDNGKTSVEVITVKDGEAFFRGKQIKA